jgi:transcriptional regulator with XRE-family HTH domain/tetratricopeptide (TPR) repeat protein
VVVGEEFGAALREARNSRGLSLAGLARLVHYSRGYLSKVENGVSKPNPAFARRCDTALGTGGELSRLVPPTRRDAPVVEQRPAATLRPFDLPPAPAHLVGRAEEAAALAGLLVGPRPGLGPGAVRQVVVHGMAGVGKTALAVQVAHQVAGDFPDGCLFLDLRSYGPDGVGLTAGEAVEIVLRRLGVAGEAIPERVADRAALYRGTVHNLRILVVIDNARRAEQVRPLIPGGSGCAVLVTSRSRLAALDDADPVRVEPLPGAAAATLFAEIAGLDAGRIGRTVADQLASIVGSCGGLPLAVRIAAASQRGSGDPYELAGLAGRLADGTRRLAELDDGERSANTALAASCADLPAERRNLLALIALQPGPDVSGAAAAWLSGLEAADSRRHLDRLVDDNLLTPSSGDRYATHELTRTFALQTLVPAVPAVARTLALRRLATGYLASADAADRVLTPYRFRPGIEPHPGPAPAREFTDAAQASAWFVDERANLVAACRLAAAEGWPTVCWQLAYALRGHLFLAKAWDAWIDTHDVALAAAQAAGDEWGEAITGGNLGLALLERGHIRSAQEHYRRSMRIFRRLGDAVGEANTLGHQAWAAYCLGDYASCHELATAALAIYQARDLPRNAAITLRTLALAELHLGRAGAADRHLRDALVIFTRLELPLDAAMACNGLGEVHAGDTVAARHWYARALQLSEACGSVYEQARAYEGLGTVAAGSGRRRAARRFRLAALDRYEALNAPEIERVRADLARAAVPGDGADQRGGQA